MSRHRLVFLVVAAGMLLATVSGTGGLNSTETDRKIMVATTDDDTGYIGFAQSTEETNQTTNLTMTVTNQFQSDVTLTNVSVTVGNESENIGPLGPNEGDTIEFSAVDCDSSIAVYASGSGVEVQFSRDVAC